MMLLNILEGIIAWQNLAVYTAFANTSRNQLRVLTSKIKDKNITVLHDLERLIALVVWGFFSNHHIMDVTFF